MFYLQLFIPAGLVFMLFGLGHTFVEVDYSGVYFDELVEEVVVPEVVANAAADEAVVYDALPEGVDRESLALLPDKYNYLKIENVFQGELADSNELFSLEVAIATKQVNVMADFFIKGLAEIEPDLVAEITKIVLDTTREQLTSVDGRILITDKIMKGLNDFLTEKNYRPDIHFVYIINHNII